TVLKLKPRQSNYGKALFIAMAWGTQIGGIATLLGGGRAPLAIGMLRDASGQSFTFLQWSLTAWPIVAVLLVAGWIIILRWFPIDIDSVRAADEIIEAKVLRMGRMSVRERAIGIIMLITLAIWIVGGEELGLANVALGSALNRSGASEWIAGVTISRWARNPVEVIAIISAIGIVLTEAMSHSAVVALLMPVALGIATKYGIAPRIMAPAVALPAGLAFTLPVGTPGNAIAYSSGYMQLRDMLIPGAILVFVAWVACNLTAIYYWPLIGLTLPR